MPESYYTGSILVKRHCAFFTKYYHDTMKAKHVFNVRFDAKTWTALCAEAKAQGRSINAQLIQLLKERYGMVDKPRPVAVN